VLQSQHVPERSISGVGLGFQVRKDGAALGRAGLEIAAVRGILARVVRIADVSVQRSFFHTLPLSSAPLSPRLHCGHLDAIR
jgi:hypothetical protein